MNDIEKPFNEITAEDIAIALANSANCELHYGLPVLLIDDDEYAVANGDEEANKAAKEYIEETLCYFNPDFLAEHSNMPESVFSHLASTGFDDNEAYKCIIHNIDDFVDDAINADGRGHFLSSYDGEEVEIDGYFLYRL